MHFRAQRKLQGEVSLSDTIETGPEGDALYLSDVVGEEDTMLEELQDKENRKLIRRLVAEVLTEREADIIRRRAMYRGSRRRHWGSWRKRCGDVYKRKHAAILLWRKIFLL